MTEEEKKEVIRKHFSELGKKGGGITYKKYGREFMSKIGKLPRKKKTN